MKKKASLGVDVADHKVHILIMQNNASPNTLNQLKARVDAAMWSHKNFPKRNLRPEFEIGMSLALASYNRAGSMKYFSEDALGLTGAFRAGFDHVARKLRTA